MDSPLRASSSHTCDSVSKSSGNNINSSSAPGNVSPMLSSGYTSSNRPSYHSQIQQPDCENSKDFLSLEAENSVQQPIQHQMITRSRAGVYKPKIPYIGSIGQSLQNSNLEPRTTKEVLSTSYWKQAMLEELCALQHSKTWVKHGF